MIKDKKNLLTEKKIKKRLLIKKLEKNSRT